jgi:hypothetical protein
MDPYTQKVNELAALKQAGMQNIGGAVSAGVDLTSKAAANKALSEGDTADNAAIAKLLEQLLGKK